jgi:hypothetical protein
MSKTKSEPVRHITSTHLTNIASFPIPPSGPPSPIVDSSKFVKLMDTTCSPVKRQMDTI